jgi:hypothetical protein
MKDKLKNAQCKWDKINRYWVANKRILSKHPEFQKYINKPTKTFFNIPFVEKDAFKDVGGKWDNDERKWFLMSNEDVSDEFIKYIVKDEEDVWEVDPALLQV